MRIIIVSPSSRVYQFYSNQASLVQDFLISKEIFGSFEEDSVISCYIDKFVANHLSKGSIEHLIVKPFPVPHYNCDTGSVKTHISPATLSFEKDIDPASSHKCAANCDEMPSIIMIDCIKKVIHSGNYLEAPNYINFIDIDNCLASMGPEPSISSKVDAYIHLIENKIFINEEIKVGPELIQSIVNNLKAKGEGSLLTPLRLPAASRFDLQADNAWKIHRVSPYHQKCGKSQAYFIQTLNSYGFMFDFAVLATVREQSLKALDYSAARFTEEEKSEDCPVFQKNMAQLSELFLAMQEKVLISNLLSVSINSPVNTSIINPINNSVNNCVNQSINNLAPKPLTSTALTPYSSPSKI